jgi:hypothetical protein
VFWKKKDNQPKAKEPTEAEILWNQQKLLNSKIVEEVETLTKEQAILYELPEFYSFARFLGFELNPTYPQKGKKYLMFTDQAVDGKPAGKKSYIGGTNKATDYSDWVSEKDSDKYGHIKRYQ